MHLTLDSLGPQPAEGTAHDQLVSRTSPAVLSLWLAEGERLDAASLVLRRAEGGGVPTPSVLLESSAEDPAHPVQWLVADWGEARRLHALTIRLAETIASPPRVRVSLDHGDWCPVEVTVTTMTTSTGVTRLQLELPPGSVAERVHVELRDAQDEPLALRLHPAESLLIDLGDEPGALGLSVRGHGELWRHDGPAPADHELRIDDLLARLPPEHRRPRADAPLVLELSAEIAGDLDLSWSFTTTRA